MFEGVNGRTHAWTDGRSSTDILKIVDRDVNPQPKLVESAKGKNVPDMRVNLGTAHFNRKGTGYQPSYCAQFQV